MKLRLTNNSLRLRLNKLDIGLLQEERVLSVSLPLGGAENQHFTYLLKAGNQLTAPSIQLIENQLEIEVPWSTVEHWISSDQVGIYDDIQTNDGAFTQLIIEKDFQCASDPIDTNVYFTNPNLDGI